MELEILIADKLSPKTVEDLEELGASVRVQPDLTADDLPGSVDQAEILVVRSTKVTRATIEAGTRLALIIRAGAGVNTIDMAAASDRGIAVANCPGKNTAAVAELAIGLLISADRRIASATADLKAGRWRKKEYQKAQGLLGRRLAILGLGAIGSAVAKRAQALGMQVCAWSRSLTPERAEELGIIHADSPKAAASGADALSVHLASSPETKGIVGADVLAALNQGAIVVNSSRGDVVDADALRAAAGERGLRIALDVYPDEPGGGDAEFTDSGLVATLEAATPHIGASTAQASEAIAAEVVRVVRSYVEQGKPVNCVNIRRSAQESVSLVVRHYNRVGVLAGVLDELRNSGINVEEMENTIFSGNAAASCSLKLDRPPSDESLDRIRAGEDIIQVGIKQVSAAV